MGVCLGKPKHHKLYDGTMKRYSSIINSFARAFEQSLRKKINRGHASIQKNSDGEVTGIEIGENDLIEITTKLTQRSKYRLKTIPPHVWCELVIAATYNNFIESKGRDTLTRAVYQSYFQRDCLSPSTDPRVRFDVEHANYTAKNR